MKRRFALLLIGLLLLGGCRAAPAPEAVKQTVVGFYFDTVITLTAYAPDDSALKAALEECAKYEKRLSKTVEGSDVWNVNHAGGKPVEVSEDTLSILRVAGDIYARSEGAFDVTIAPATALWNFKGDNPALPDAAALAQAAALTDFSKVQIDGNRVMLPAGMQIDLGGVAKGYIADRLIDFLRSRGVEHAVLSLGGNVVTLGDRPDQARWRVGIQDPDKPTGDYMLVATTGEGSVVTSGVYERFFVLDGVRYHHILDTATGWPVQNGLKSVTIFSESSALGDALSTACFALGAEKGLALAESLPGVEALMITDDRARVQTSGADAYFQ